MDIGLLASAVTEMLLPLLPRLQRIGQEIGGRALNDIGKSAEGKAGALWERMWCQIEGRPAARDAAEDIAANPADGDALAALRLQIKKLLTEDPELAAELFKLVAIKESTVPIEIHQQAGDHAIQVGQVRGNTRIERE